MGESKLSLRVLQVSTMTFVDPRYYQSNELKLCRSLVKLGHEVTLLTSTLSPRWAAHGEREVQKSSEEVDGFSVRRFAAGPEFGNVPLTPELFNGILKLKWDWNILHTHEIIAPSSFYSGLASCRKKRPYVVTQHDYEFGGTHGAKMFLHATHHCTLGRFTLSMASAVIGLSSAAVNFCLRFGASPNRTCVIPSSTDVTAFRPGQRSLLTEKWGIEGPIVLFVGRLDRNKAPYAVLEAYHKAISTVPSARLVMVGNGPEKDALLAVAKKLNLDHVYWIERVPREEMPRVYAGCELLVLPSLFEPFGNVVLEAMASGVPVVGSRIGGMKDTIIHGETGYLIKPGDAAELAKYMITILQDKDLQSEMSRAARQVAVERFDDMVVAKAVESVYLNSLKDRS